MLKLFLPIILTLAAFIGTGDMIHACVDTESGAVRVVGAESDCQSGETPLEWGIIGVQGPKGEKGDAGVGDIGCTTDQIAKWDGSQWVCANLPSITALETRVAQLEELLQHFSRSNNEITISGANLHIVNGLGNTETTNSLGNVIIGYNEKRTSPGVIVLNPRTGSHMLVLGKEHTYTGYGGLIVGRRHDVSGNYASVSGGAKNTISGDYASVSGGYENTASGEYSSVSGGSRNTSSGQWASVAGGWENSASAGASTVSGGTNNKAKNIYATVSGGYDNLAGGASSTVSGGANGVVSGQYDWLAGDLFRED